jgi:DNA ligase (NAD+)
MYTPERQQYYTDLSKKFLITPASVKDLEDLRNLLIFHERKYYIEDNPLISDYEYDQLYKQLVQLEEEHPDLITADSPTQRVSTDLSGDAKSVQHTVPMLSLDNSYNEDDLNDFDAAVKKLADFCLKVILPIVSSPNMMAGALLLYMKMMYS